MNMTSNNFNYNLKSVKGSFAVENMEISQDGIKNLLRIENGELSFSAMIEELKQKYTQRV